jgi:hypothetical protein
MLLSRVCESKGEGLRYPRWPTRNNNVRETPQDQLARTNIYVKGENQMSTLRASHPSRIRTFPEVVLFTP